MVKNNNDTSKMIERKAKKLIRENPLPEETFSPQQLSDLIQSLRIHQVELEMQNVELRQAQEALEASRDKYFQLFNQAPCGYVIVDHHGVILQSNKVFADMLNTDNQSITGRPLFQYIHPKDVKQVLGRYSSFFKRPGGKTIELRLVRSPGRTVHVSLSGQRQRKPFAEAGKNEDLLLVMYDISDRKQAEQELLRSRDRLNTIIEDIPAMICRFNPEGAISYINKEFCIFYGKHESEVTGKIFFDFLPKEKRQLIQEQFSKLTPTHPVRHDDYQMMSAKGEWRWQRWTSRAIFQKNKTVRVYQAIGYDITEQIQIEKEIRDKEKLTGVIELAGAVCHELSQPMQIITGLSSLMMMGIGPGTPLYTKLEKINDQVSRMNMLTGKLNNITHYGTKGYGRNDTIIDLENSTERRSHKRFMPRETALIQTESNIATSGQLIDISSNGISFWSTASRYSLGNSLRLNIFTTTEEFHLEGLPCILLSNSETWEGPEKNTEKVKRHRVQFKNLTPHQIDQIESFIRNYTTE